MAKRKADRRTAKRAIRHDEPPAPDAYTAPPRQQIVNGAISPAEWRDPSDAGAAARMRGARIVSGWQRVWTIEVLHLANSREITSGMVKAAQRLLSDYERGIEGATAGGMNDKVDGSASGGVTDGRLAAIGRYRDAMEAVGPRAGVILTMVVVDNCSIARLADWLGLSRDRTHGRVAAGLERLREHYWPPRQNAAAAAPQDAPEPLLDGGLAEGSPLRLGRWRGSGARDGA